ncbi:pectin lyase-like protein [Wilcoxina mikolae CBS 423.85]|nr:pectin lyase-like protein [Wilcoxina mikolae CBS 423.85]
MISQLSSVVLFGLSLLGFADAAARTSPPAGCVVVSKSPSSGQFSSVQAAVDSLSTTATGGQCIFIYGGTYNEQVLINERSAQLTIYGYTTDTSSYLDNTVTITQGRSQDDTPTNDLTATLRAHNTGLKVYNINLQNTRGSVQGANNNGRQALAVSALAGNQGYYGVQFIGYQDTILANQGSQLYARCYIEGVVDIIFGQFARAWFDAVDIRINGKGCITASGRDSDSNPSYYVFNNSNIKPKTGVSVATGSIYLGRPWRNYARVVFQRTDMTDIINPSAWKIWGTSSPNTDHVYLREWKNTGAGAVGTRASFGGYTTADIPISLILGSDYATWADTSYLS